MEKLVKLKIDGKEVEAPAGINLIDAAELAGIHIPNLCYLKGMKGIGACRLCLVEVEGLKAPVIACNTKVKEGLVVTTRGYDRPYPNGTGPGDPKVYRRADFVDASARLHDLYKGGSL